MQGRVDWRTLCGKDNSTGKSVGVFRESGVESKSELPACAITLAIS